MNTIPSWLKDTVFYEIYPQSFYDTNQDGIGDLPGIIDKLDYIQSLGVNALWLNPCFESPFQDAGYDVSDYYKVAPRYGTNNDLKCLFDEGRKRGIRVLLDLVPGHTSHLHPWFQASCRHERNTHSDWYIWTDSGWTWEVPGFRLINGYAERDGTYVTNFFYSQPALNYGFANPDPRYPWQQPIDAPGPQAVRRELRKIMAFWLDMGCAGFRVDMAASLVKNDPGRRETIKLWQEVRAWLDSEYPEAALVAEWGNPPEALGAGYHMDFLLGFGSAGYQSLVRKTSPGGAGFDPYGCSFFDPAGRGNICQFVDEYQAYYDATKDQGLICLITGNHDIVPRLGDGRTTDDLELYYLFMLTMPGVPFICYGDEIGMHTVNGLPSKEGSLSRAGARTPMQWNDSPNAGFSTAPADALYLPIDPDPQRPTVAAQEDDPTSLLKRVCRLTALRHARPALQAGGDFQVVYAEGGKYPFVYQRSEGDEVILVAINPADYPVEVSLHSPAGEGQGGDVIETLYGLENPFIRSGASRTLKMPGISGGAYRIG
ncbi:MAG: glycosylase [Anaerolineae bacterium]|nr:glycosylase [Anaerolineae bacterium]